MKPYIANKTANENPYKSEFFIYVDPGSFRQRSFRNWPDEATVKKSHDEINNRLLMGLIGDSSYHTNPSNDLIGGNFFGGSNTSLKNFSNNFYDIHDERFEKGLFIGKHETIINILAFTRNPNIIILLNSYQNTDKCNCPGDNKIFTSLSNKFRCTNNVGLFFIHYFYTEINCSKSKDSMLINVINII